MSKITERQKFIQYWKDVTGKTEVDMLEVAKLALKMGWDAPPEITREERLAKQFKGAARQDIRHDKKTGRPYRGYHAVPKADDGSKQTSFTFIDIDDPNTKPDRFRKACVLRREQTVGDVTQLRLDQLHWNDSHPADQQVDVLPGDLELDIKIRLAAMDHKDDAA